MSNLSGQEAQPTRSECSRRVPDDRPDMSAPRGLMAAQPLSDGETTPTHANYYDGGGSMMETNDAILAKMATRASLTADSAKLILAMVGLPARGKSFISHKLYAFLNWSGTRTQIFNAGQKRRLAEPEESTVASSSAERPMQRERSAASFFDPTDESAKAAREEIAMQTLDELLQWFEEGGEVGIYDATNSTLARRGEVLARAAAAAERAGHSVNVVFIESICDETALLEANMCARSPETATPCSRGCNFM